MTSNDRSRADGPGTSPPERSRPRWLRHLLFGLGLVFTGIGIVGVILPGLPGTVFLILATACFSRSSPRFEAWLLNHPTFGPSVRRWRETGAIPRRAKWFASVSIALSWILVDLSDAPSFVKIGTAVVLLGVVGFIVTRPDGTG